MRAALGSALAVVALTACPIHAPAPVPGPEQGEWQRLRNAATRQAELYDVLEHRATLRVTYLSPAVREARAHRLAEWLGWTGAELARRLDEERAEASQFDDFVFALYTAERKVNDLDAPKSVWRLALKLPPADVLASEVTVLDDDATLRQLFPYVGSFDTVYRVRFPRTEPALSERPFVLEVASALGQLRLDFGAPAKPLTWPRPAP